MDAPSGAGRGLALPLGLAKGGGDSVWAVPQRARSAVAYSVKLPIYQSASGEVGKLYVFLKADAACTVDQTTVTWTET